MYFTSLDLTARRDIICKQYFITMCIKRETKCAEWLFSFSLIVERSMLSCKDLETSKRNWMVVGSRTQEFLAEKRRKEDKWKLYFHQRNWQFVFIFQKDLFPRKPSVTFAANSTSAKFNRKILRPTMLYGGECWASKAHVHKVIVADMWILKWTCVHTRLDKIRNDHIHEQVQVAYTENKMREYRLS